MPMARTGLRPLLIRAAAGVGLVVAMWLVVTIGVRVLVITAPATGVSRTGFDGAV